MALISDINKTKVIHGSLRLAKFPNMRSVLIVDDIFEIWILHDRHADIQKETNRSHKNRFTNTNDIRWIIAVAYNT